MPLPSNCPKRFLRELNDMGLDSLDLTVKLFGFYQVITMYDYTSYPFKSPQFKIGDETLKKWIFDRLPEKDKLNFLSSYDDYGSKWKVQTTIKDFLKYLEQFSTLEEP